LFGRLPVKDGLLPVPADVRETAERDNSIEASAIL
jgi:hypothetical protein